MQTPTAHLVRFGEFEVDFQTGQVRKSGLDLRIQEQPRLVLLALLERPGAVVTREELRRRLWPEGTFVDFEHSLNTAVKKLRDALGDSAGNPRFIETVPLRGYRFALVAGLDGQGQQGPPVSPRGGRRSMAAWVVTAAASVAALSWMARTPPAPKLLGSSQLTFSGNVRTPGDGWDYSDVLATDGARIYFSDGTGPAAALAQISVAGGEVLRVPAPIDGPVRLLHLSPDGSQFLVSQGSAEASEGPVWVMPVPGGAPRRLADMSAHDAAWSADGRQIVYARADALYIARSDGSDVHLLAAGSGRASWIRWSPDGRRLRFTALEPRTHESSLWEVSSEGKDLHRLLTAWEGGEACCGEWTPDGRHFVFEGISGGKTSIWVMRDLAGVLGRSLPEPTRLTSGPLDLSGAVPSRDGKRLFVVGSQSRTEALSFDLRSGAFTPYGAASVGREFSLSDDGKWLAYVADTGGRPVLWRSRVDGTERLQLTSPPLRPWVIRWSPDAKRIAVMGRSPGGPWTISTVASSGGALTPLTASGRNEADPNWSPDGRSVMFGQPPDYVAEPGAPRAISIVDATTRQRSRLPGSQGLFSPRWSPGGRHVIALSLDQAKVMLYEFSTGQWSQVAPPVQPDGLDRPKWHVNNPVWSRDGTFVYLQECGEEALWRLRMSDRSLERVVSLRQPNRPRLACGLAGLAVDGSPLLSCTERSSDIYALDWDAR